MSKCMFCSRMATAKNAQGIYTCSRHKYQSIDDIQCVCGEMLQIKTSKYGPFFVCKNCGTMSLKKGLSMAES